MFNGKLLELSADGGKVKFDNFPLGNIFKESYTITPNRIQDKDSTRNANGGLKRNVLAHTATTISITTKPMWSDDMEKLINFIVSHYTIAAQRKLRIRYYCPDLASTGSSYKIGDFYIADFGFTVNMIKGNKILYNPVTFEFIEY